MFWIGYLAGVISLILFAIMLAGDDDK